MPSNSEYQALQGAILTQTTALDIHSSTSLANANPVAAASHSEDTHDDMDIETPADEPVPPSSSADPPAGTQILLAGTGTPGRDGGLGSLLDKPATPPTTAERAEQLAREAEWHPTTDWNAWRTSPLPNGNAPDTDRSSLTPDTLSVSTQPTDELSVGQPENHTRELHRRERAYYNEDYIILNNPPPRTYHQQRCRAEMSKTLGRLLAQYLPLTNIHFGSRISQRSYNKFNKLREAIPRHIFVRFFREYGSYSALAEGLCSTQDNYRKTPNRWLPYLPRIRRIRELITEYIVASEHLLEAHGYIDGLKEYVIKNHLETWEDEQHTGGVFHLHELQYLHCLRRFLSAEEYDELAVRTQQLLQRAPDHPGDLWALVYTIFECLVPPSYEYQLDCNFEPRTDDMANLKRAHIEQYGSLMGFCPPH
jgi:hypothetical protein